jgi:Fe-S cluster assembly protein SufD
MTTEVRDFLPAKDVVTDVSRRLAETEDLLSARLSAYGRLQERGMPDRVEHLWTFTDPRHLLPGDYTLGASAVTTADVPDGAAARIVLRPGSAPMINITAEARAMGLVAAPIDSFLDVSRADDPGDDTAHIFNDLNEALWNCGARIGLPRGAVIEAPVLISVQAGAGATLPRVIVDAGEGAILTVIEEHVGGAEGSRIVGRTDMHAAANAHLHHVLVQRWEHGVHGHLTLRGRADRDADLLTVFASLGGDRAKVEVLTDLVGDGARSEMRGVALGAGRQRFDHHTRHRHRAGRTWSNIDFKAVADEQARSSYTGLIRIEEAARTSEAFQENRNLLLSDTGRADSIPELEILNEDVSCSHGATVAPVDPEQLFYLQSRGLDADEALRLIIQGFLGQTLERLSDDVRKTVETLIGARLDTLRGRAA